MDNIPEHLKEDLLNYLPPYILEEVSCYVIGDNHPMCKKSVDITVCTCPPSGIISIKELSNREIIGFLPLDCSTKPTRITSTRNRYCELFYIVTAADELFIINGEKLEVLRKICNVILFDFMDSLCTGEGFLRVMSTDYVTALEFDNSFNIVQENQNPESEDVNSSALSDLQQKLVEAQYNVIHNEYLLEDYKKLHQNTAFEMFKKMYPDLSYVGFQHGCKKMAAELSFNIKAQWMKSFNDKFIITLELSNEKDIPLEDLNMLIQEKKIPTMVTTTKLYEATKTPPFWTELTTKYILKKNTQTAIVTLLRIKELENNITGKIKINAVLLYKISGQEKYLPLEMIEVSAKELQEESFSLLCSSVIGNKEMLAILAASTKTDLIFHYISRSLEHYKLQDLFKKIGMEQLMIGGNLMVYKKSSYDRLYGVIVTISLEEGCKGPINVAVYSRNESQVLLLIQMIQDTTDERIVIITPQHRVEAITTEMADYNYIPREEKKTKDCEKLSKSLLKQVIITKEYLEDCMAKMHESNDEKVLNSIGRSIDIFSCGFKQFEKFKGELFNEMSDCVELVDSEIKVESVKEDSGMIVESEEF